MKTIKKGKVLTWFHIRPFYSEYKMAQNAKIHIGKSYILYNCVLFSLILSDFQIHCDLEEGSVFAILGSMKMISVILRVCTYVCVARGIFAFALLLELRMKLKS